MSGPTERPRLVYDADASAAPDGPGAAPPARSSLGTVALVILAAALLAVGAAGFTQYQRALALETRVAELTADLDRARGEIAARRQHLDAIRTSVADVQQRLDALESLAAREPSAPRTGATVPSEPAPTP